VREPLNQPTTSLIPCSDDDCKPGCNWANCRGRSSASVPRVAPCPSRAWAGGPNKPMTVLTTGSAAVAASARTVATTFSFLPAFSLPNTYYSLIARSAALRRRFLEGRSWEHAARRSNIPIACRHLPACAAGAAAWIACFRLLRSAPRARNCSQWLECGESTVFGRCGCLGIPSTPVCESPGPGLSVSKINVFLARPSSRAGESGVKISSLALRGVWM
jgi:hypothetical protein